MAIDAEISAHALSFRASLNEKISGNLDAIIASSSAKLDEAYARLTTLQAWRNFVLEEHTSPAAVGFYSEAQNDGLTSSVLIMAGLWRPAMKSLRSLIENILHCLYFNDHPVEYRLWDSGKFRPSFKELFDYFLAHPDVSNLPAQLNGALELKLHYKHLSNVVHASAREFRMTSEIETLKLWKTTADGVGKWASTHKNVLRDVNLLLLSLFSSRVQGASNKGLRESLAIVIPASRDSAVKTNLGVKIIR